MMRILWFSNKILAGRDSGSTGTWLDAMAQGLVNSGSVVLANISKGEVPNVTQQDHGNIQQWVVPIASRTDAGGMPSSNCLEGIRRAVEEYSPDLIHVWGTESYWGLLTARGLFKSPALLEMQGLKGVCSRLFHGGLSWREQMSCLGLKEILKGSPIIRQRRQFAKWGVIEAEIISKHHFITTQSDYTTAWVKALNRDCFLFRTERPLRNPFYEDPKWFYTGEPRLFCLIPAPLPYKGLHVVIRALCILKRKFPVAKLMIGGAIQKPGLRQDGYTRWVNRLARKLGVQESIVWLGPLAAADVARELRACSAVVLPSYVETYGVAFAESMIMGAPAVVAYSGGAAYLGKDEESVLFFPAGDEAMCAYQVSRLIEDRMLAEGISQRARSKAMVRNDVKRVVSHQIEIYREVLGTNSNLESNSH